MESRSSARRTSRRSQLPQALIWAVILRVAKTHVLLFLMLFLSSLLLH